MTSERATDHPNCFAEAQAKIIRLNAEIARLVEDRSRFPDRPDDIGRMIESHIGNLKLGKEAADQHAIRAMNRSERLRAALEDARRDFNALCPRSDTGSKRKRAIEAAVKRIEDTLAHA